MLLLGVFLVGEGGGSRHSEVVQETWPGGTEVLRDDQVEETVQGAARGRSCWLYKTLHYFLIL